MILVVSNPQDGHGDVVCKELSRAGAEYIRLSFEDYPQHLKINYTLGGAIESSFIFQSRVIPFSSISSIWYRRPGYPVYNAKLHSDVKELVAEETEKLTSSFWCQFDVYWMSRPDYILRAEYKPLQLQIAQQIGWTIPRTLITNDPNTALDFYEENNKNIIIKPISRSWLDLTQGDKKQEIIFFTTPVTPEKLHQLQSVEYCPTLLQQRIIKDFELRVTVVGDRIFACRIDSQKSERAREDWRRYDLDNTPHTIFTLPPTIEDLCLKLTSAMGLNFGAIDIIVDKSGEYVLCEINPNGQWYWIEVLTGLPITSALAQTLIDKVNIALPPQWTR